MADPALTPELALDYLSELSTDIRAAVVLGSEGQHLAGPEVLAAPARQLLAAAAGALVEVDTPGGTVVAAADDLHALAVVVGRHALPALVRYDVRRVLGDLAGNEEPEAA